MGAIYKRGKNYYVDVRVGGKRIRKKVGHSLKITELVLKDYEVKIARKEFDLEIADEAIAVLFKTFIRV